MCSKWTLNIRNEQDEDGRDSPQRATAAVRWGRRGAGRPAALLGAGTRGRLAATSPALPPCFEQLGFAEQLWQG